MRRTGWGTRTVRPTSSVTSRKAGDGEEIGEALCARDNAAQDSKAAIAATMTHRRRWRADSFTILPTRHSGACGIALSREERGLLRHGRVAWLTAFQPITVAGPRPIRTAFPASLACKLKIECMTRPRECQCATEKGPAKDGMAEKTPPLFSDFSSWVCAFLPVRANLPGNPRGGRV